MSASRKRKIEFGDFQTPDSLALAVCAKLTELGISPEVVVEPTCGLGAFVVAAASCFPTAQAIHGIELNEGYLATLQQRMSSVPAPERIQLGRADFFTKDWNTFLGEYPGSLLVLGNLPWVTNSTQGSIGGSNLPQKSNFQNSSGFDAISGKANFDISEWMLMEVLRWFKGRSGAIAMLVKTAVARKILAHVERQKLPVREASIHLIDAKKEFNAAVEACLLVIRLVDKLERPQYDYSIYGSLSGSQARRVGHRDGLTVGDLDAFEASSYLLGKSPNKWRSGVKHDASPVMELTRTTAGLINGLDELVDIESDCLYPLLKGSDIGAKKHWREKFVLLTQHHVGDSTDWIRDRLPKTWRYLEGHAGILDARASTIYSNNPRFSIFGIGDYAFRPWRIAICALYKSLEFRLTGPIEAKPVMFDDTVYYLSFDTESEAREALDLVRSEPSLRLLSSLIFWDDKRPIKTGILNMVDWSRLGDPSRESTQLAFDLSGPVMPPNPVSELRP